MSDSCDCLSDLFDRVSDLSETIPGGLGGGAPQRGVRGAEPPGRNGGQHLRLNLSPRCLICLIACLICLIACLICLICLIVCLICLIMCLIVFDF